MQIWCSGSTTAFQAVSACSNQVICSRGNMAEVIALTRRKLAQGSGESRLLRAAKSLFEEETAERLRMKSQPLASLFTIVVRAKQSGRSSQ